MAWSPSFNVLQLCVTFLEATAKTHHCTELSNALNLPVATTFNSLDTMVAKGWIEKIPTEEKRTSEALVHLEGDHAVHYRLTESGLNNAVKCLTRLRVPFTGYRASA